MQEPEPGRESLRGRVALVTGGARRVGAVLVRTLAAHGAAVAIHYGRSRAEAESLALALRREGGQAAAIQADLRLPEAVAALFSAVERQLGPIGILVNNAAVFERSPIEDIDPESWDRVLETNLRAPFLCVRQAVPRMRSLGGGDVLNLADLAGFQAWPSSAHHCAAKAGLIALTRSLALELAPRIRVNAIAPGLVLHAEGEPQPRRQRIEQAIPAQRGGSPADVASAMLYLLGAPQVTGVILPVDGGRLAGAAVVVPGAGSAAPGQVPA